MDVYVRNVLAVSFDKYFDAVWPYFGEGIVADYMIFSHIENMIGSENGNLGGKLGFAFINKEKYEIIFQWCKNNPGKAVERIAHMMPLSVEKDGKVTWHPFSKKFIDEFGDNEKVISQLNSNIGAYGTVGSRVPYFLIQKQLFQELIHHHIPRVKDWAIEMLAYTEKLIILERIDDEEHFL